MFKYALKVYAILINQIFIYNEYFLYFNKVSAIKNILFSEKEWWDKLLQKGPFAKKFNKTFSIFEPTNMKNYDLIVPLTIPDLETCIKNKDILSENPIPFPNYESFNICNNKSLFDKFMKSNGFEKYLPKHTDKMQFPYILKKSQDEGGENTHIIKNHLDVEVFKDLLNDPEYMRQNIVLGQREYATHVIIKNGEIINALTIVYVFEKPYYIKGKDQYICRFISKNKNLDIFESILLKMNFNGICCFNFKEINGVPIIFEINPRFGGSLCDYFYPFLLKAF